MGSLEELPLTFIQASQELRTLTQCTTRVMSVICDLGRALLECLSGGKLLDLECQTADVGDYAWA